MDYFIWNEIPTVLGNLVGGLSLTGLTLYSTHVKTAPKLSRHLPSLVQLVPKAGGQEAAGRGDMLERAVNKGAPVDGVDL
jgi:hypothetical protein